MFDRLHPFVAALVVSIAPTPLFAQVEVTAAAETEPVPNGGDAADDPAVWVHPTDPARSVVIGTDKQGGIAVYALDGEEVQYLSVGDVNNVDVRYGFDLSGTPVDLAIAGNRSDDTVSIFTIDPDDGTLTDVTGDAVDAELSIYGSCAYRSRVDGSFYVFANAKSGEVVQHRLVAQGDRVNLEEVRQLEVDSQVEGCVADDDTGLFFLGEEAEGIWRFGAEPGDPTDGELIASTDDELEADVEGLTIHYHSDGGGYLIASSQGNDTYVVFDRNPPHAHVATFEIVDGGGIDGTSDTDGIDVVSTGLSGPFGDGIFVAQDGSNDDGNQNFKLVSWGDIASEAGLDSDPSYDPRADVTPTPGDDAGTSPGDMGDAGSVESPDIGVDPGDMANSSPDVGSTPGTPGNGADSGTGGSIDTDAGGRSDDDSDEATASGCGCGQAGGGSAALALLLGALVFARSARRRIA